MNEPTPSDIYFMAYSAAVAAGFSAEDAKKFAKDQVAEWIKSFMPHWGRDSEGRNHASV